MTSPSDTTAGFTLFEVLVALAVLTMAISVVVAGLRGPSPALRASETAAELRQVAATLRRRAITGHKQETWDLTEFSCDPDRPHMIFFPDGSAFGPDICISGGKTDIRLTLVPAIGLYEQDGQ